MLALILASIGAAPALAAKAACADRSVEHMLMQVRHPQSSSAWAVREEDAAHSDKEPVLALNQYDRSAGGEEQHQMGWYSLFWCPPNSHRSKAVTVPLPDNSFVPVLASHSPGNEAVEQAVIVIHGAPREAEGYFGDVFNIVHQQHKSRRTLVLAPAWADKACSAADWSSGNGAQEPVRDSAQALYWTGLRRWMYGGRADNANSSSFEVLDSVVDWVQASYPSLKRVVVTGFSAGAQFLVRWAALSSEGANGVTRRGGLPLRIIAGSPSTVLYLSEERPDAACVPDKDGGRHWKCTNFSNPMDGRNCGKNWNRYPNGLGGLHQAASSPGHIRYTANEYLLKSIGATSSSEVSKQVRARWATKDIRFLFGNFDTTHCHVGACSNDCEHMVTGKNRLQRGLNFMRHLERVFPGSQPVWGIFNHGHTHIGAYWSHYFRDWALVAPPPSVVEPEEGGSDGDKKAGGSDADEVGGSDGDEPVRREPSEGDKKEGGSDEDEEGGSHGDVESACTPADSDPYASGHLVGCCDGLVKTFGLWGKGWQHYRCKPASREPEEGGSDGDKKAGGSDGDAVGGSGDDEPVTREPEEGGSDVDTKDGDSQVDEIGGSHGVKESICTPADSDPYASDSFVRCCGDLVKSFGRWGKSWWHYLCKPASRETEEGGSDGDEQEEASDRDEEGGPDGDDEDVASDRDEEVGSEGDAEEVCTPADSDPYASGHFVKCCDDLMKSFGSWGKRWLHYRCKPASH